MKRWRLASALLGIATLTAACSGGGGGTTVPTAPVAGAQAGTVSGSAVLTIPTSKSTSSGTRQPQFVSPSAGSIGVTVNGGNPTYSNVSTSSSLCTSSGSGRTCTIPLTASPGQATFAFTLYDGANGGGNVLGSGSTTQSLQAGQPFTVAVVLNGTVATVVLSVSSSSLTPGSSATITVTAKDADGNTITGPGTFSSPVILTDSDTSGASTISPTQVTSPGQTATLTYGASSATVLQATLGAQAAGVTAGGVTPVMVSLAAGPSSSPAPLAGATPYPAPSVGGLNNIQLVTATVSGNGTTINGSESVTEQVSFTPTTATITWQLLVSAGGASYGNISLTQTLPVSTFPIPYTSAVASASLSTANSPVLQAVTSALTGTGLTLSNLAYNGSLQALGFAASGASLQVCVTPTGSTATCTTVQGSGASVLLPDVPTLQAAQQAFGNWILDYQCTQPSLSAAAIAAYGSSACSSAVASLSATRR